MVSNQHREELEIVVGGSCVQKSVVVSEGLCMRMRSAASLRGVVMKVRRRCSRETKEVVILSVQSFRGAGAGRFRFRRRVAICRGSSKGMKRKCLL